MPITININGFLLAVSAPNEQALCTPSQWPKAIVEALQDYGINGLTVCNAIGMDHSQLSHADSIYLQDQVTDLWNAAAQESQDPLFGLKTGLKVQSTAYPSLGYALMASKNFLACCQRLFRFQNILAEGLILDLKAENDQHVLTLDIRPSTQPASQYAVDAMFSSLLNFIGWLTQSHVTPVKATLKRPAPNDTLAFQTFFQCPIEFSCSANALYFSPDQMRFPLATADETIAKIHDANIEKRLNKSVKGNVTSHVRNLIIQALQDGEPKLEQVASNLHLSSSTLKRRLAEEDINFKQLLDNTRCQLALSYLHNNQLSLAQISESLGFSEVSGFNRAFKRWKGVSPKQWQKDLPT